MSSVPEIGMLAPVQPDPGRAFPTEPHLSMTSYFPAYADELAAAARTVDGTALDRAAEILLGAYIGDRTVFSCGNGGSAAIANHTQCDHVKGVRAKTGLAPRVVSLSNNVELMTAIANDLAFEDLFAYQLECPRPPGRRARRDLVVGPFAEHHPRARVRARQRTANDRAHRIRRWRSPEDRRRRDPRRLRRTTASSRTCTSR